MYFQIVLKYYFGKTNLLKKKIHLKIFNQFSGECENKINF